MNFLDPRLPDRFWSKCIPEPNSGCWLWLAGLTGKGYGSFSFNGRSREAHIVARDTLAGPIANGLVSDHLCRTRSCVNPAHIEAVTHRTNILRGEGVAARRARQLSCVRGHALTGPGADVRITRQGSRQCRACLRFVRSGTT